MRVHLDWIGCRLNQSEMELMAARFHQLGHGIAENPAESDLIVINTCDVTAAAGSDSRGLIRRSARANPGAKIVVTGCWSELNPAQAQAMQGIFQICKNEDKPNLPEMLLDRELKRDQPQTRVPLTGCRKRTRAHVKVQDGCDYHCTYCITTLARGRSRSVPIHEVLNRMLSATEAGTKEVVLCGVALSSYGRDLRPRISLGDLLAEILVKSAIQRIRLSSLEPFGLPEDFFTLWQDPRLCPCLHLPLQSGCDRTLQRMNRPSSRGDFSRIVEAARAQIPDLGLSTDVLVGFPGETEREFESSLEFIQEMEFAGGHVFSYSPRPGTQSVGYSNPIHPGVRKLRNRTVRETLENSKRAYARKYLNRTLKVLWEAGRPLIDGGFLHRGLSSNGIRVHTLSECNLHNRITLTQITGLVHSEVLGESIGPAVEG